MHLNQEKKLKSRRLKNRTPNESLRDHTGQVWNKKNLETSWRAILSFRNLFSQRSQRVGFLFLQKVFITLLIFAWIFSGWPQAISFAQEATSTPTDNPTSTSAVSPPPPTEELSSQAEVPLEEEFVEEPSATRESTEKSIVDYSLSLVEEKNNFELDEFPEFKFKLENLPEILSQKNKTVESQKSSLIKHVSDWFYRLFSNDKNDERWVGLKIRAEIAGVEITPVFDNGNNQFIIRTDDIKHIAPGEYTLKIYINDAFMVEQNFTWGGNPLAQYSLNGKRILVLSNDLGSQSLWSEEINDSGNSWKEITKEIGIKNNSPIGFLENVVFWVTPDDQALVGFDTLSQVYFSQTIEPWEDMVIEFNSRKYNVLIQDNTIALTPIEINENEFQNF